MTPDTATLPAVGSGTLRPARNAGLDALRGALTLLVLLHHTALTYGAIGGWFYREVPTDTRAETTILILFCTVNQAFFMGLFFLIAGYFTPGALQRAGAASYARERLKRLGLPLLVFGFFIGPFTAALAQTTHGLPFLGTLFWLLRHGVFINGPLWFAQALLIFSAAYMAWHAIMRRLPPVLPFPSNAALALGMLATGAGAFALRLLWPVGQSAWGLQIAYFASYIVLFATGCAGARSGWLVSVPDRQRRTWLIIAALSFPLLPAVVALAPGIPALRGTTSGGFNIQAAVYAFWEPLVAWGIILGLLRMFCRRFATLGPVWSKLSRRAFAIYIIHPPVLVAIALAWRPVVAPHLVKFAVTGSLTCLVCYWLAGVLLRAAWLRQVV